MSIESIFGNLDRAAALLKEKLLVLWPASRQTPPTESNIVTSCIQSFNYSDYYVFTECPFEQGGKQGRLDFLAYNKSEDWLVIGEMKSDKLHFDDEILNDFNRMQKFQLTDIPVQPVTLFPKDTYILVGYWTEVPDKIVQLIDICDNGTSGHSLSNIILSCDKVKYYALDETAGKGKGLHLFFFLKKI